MSVTVKETQGRGRPTVFTQEVVNKIKVFVAEGMTYEKMGEVVGIHPKTIRAFVSRNRDSLNIDRRGHRGFDKEWYGFVPLGHWTVCKPWGSEAFYRVLRRANRLGVGVGYYEGENPSQ